MSDISNLRSTIIPKSDQLNADQLLGNDMPITVTSVTLSASPDQPLTIHYDGENGRPFKPCKTMRKVLIALWGEDGNTWIGRSMLLFCDTKVKWAGEEVGGIRIKAVSHIDCDKMLSLTETRGKKAKIKIMKMLPENNAAYVTPIGFDKAACIATLKAAAKGGTAALLAEWQKLDAGSKKAIAADMPTIKAEAAKHDKPVDGFDD
jgi:hypothetical protein